MNDLRTLVEFAENKRSDLNFNVDSLDGESDLGLSVTITYSSKSDHSKLTDSELSNLQSELNQELKNYGNDLIKSVILKEGDDSEIESLVDYVQSNKNELREIIDKSRAND